MAVIAQRGICRVAPDDVALLSRVEAAAGSTGRPARPLRLQVLMQAPQLADQEGFIPLMELDHLTRELAGEIPPREEWGLMRPPPGPRFLRFTKVAADRARDVMSRFHYLRSPRFDGRAFGLSQEDGPLVAMCVISPMDVPRLNSLLSARGRATERALVVSRVFAFEGAPRNSLSFLLARCADEERRLGATDLITYVNPNLGFTGVSYRASGWDALGHEPGTTYRYLDRRYITDRELARRFGAHEDSAYHEMLGDRFAVSRMPLQPLLVFHRPLA